MSANKILRYYRLVDGRRIPCVLEIDETMLEVSHTTDTATLSHVSRGRGVDSTPAGQRRRLISRWVSGSVEDNPIPGTEEIRQDYYADRAALIGKHKARGTPCPSCELGKLIRKYQEVLTSKGFL